MTCKQQADCVDCYDESFDEQVGQGWAFCDYTTGEAELPVCECMEEWQPDPIDCPKAAADNLPTFHRCNTADEILKACGKVENGKLGMSYCKTKQARCKEQSESVVYPSMIGAGWAFCDAEDNLADVPVCECREKWTYDTSKCSEHPREMEGCPDLADLRVCEPHNTVKAICKTTYKTCSLQNWESYGEGYAQCSSDSNEPQLADCECMDAWENSEEGTECEDNPMTFRGCPQLDHMRTQCNKDEPKSWCLTKDFWCNGQDEESWGNQWTYCDPATQMSTHQSNKGSIIWAVVLTFFITLLLCVGMMVGAVYVFRNYQKKKTAKMTAQLLDDEDSYGNSEEVISSKNDAPL
jgi:hypothetical protein